jgi:MerR family transcriptional regulator/heat shock protein HspR
MNPSAAPDETGMPVFECDSEATYSVDILAELSGVSSDTILEYHEHGLIRPVAAAALEPRYDDEAIRRLRRLDALRQIGGMNLAGLCLVARLLDEVEQLREERRGQP